MADDFSDESVELDSPCNEGESVTPHDTTKLAKIGRCLYVGVAGDVTVLMAGGSTLTLKNAVAGSLLPIRVQRVNATGTTGGAGDYVALS